MEAPKESNFLGSRVPFSIPPDTGQVTSSLEEAKEDACGTLLALGVSTAFSGFCVFLEAKTRSLGQVPRSAHGSDDNGFVCATELVCACPAIFSSH